MNRSPSPFLRWPPAPRSPSSSKAPVMSEPGITSPVGWNCTISMSRRDRPARYASAMPSAALSAEHAITRYIVGPPPVARSVTRAATAMKRPVRMSRTSAPAARPASSRSSSTARHSSSPVMFGRAWVCSARRFMISMPVRSPLWIVRSWLFGDERPDELLVVDEAAARERVEQVRLEGVGLGEDRVVAALHHAGAAGAPEEPLDDDRDAELRRRVGGVEGRAKARAARAEDQDV